MTIKNQFDQFEIVNQLLKRQEQALAQLDLLDAKVGQMIEELIGNRERLSIPADPDFQTF